MGFMFTNWGSISDGPLGRLKSSDWSADSAAKLLWSLARYGKGEEILKHRQVGATGR